MSPSSRNTALKPAMLGSILSAFFVAFAIGQSQPEELSEFIESAEKARVRTVDEPFKAKVDALDGNYAAALNRAGVAAQKSGDLEAAIQIKSELDRLEAGEPFDIRKMIEPTSASRIVATYRITLQEIEAERKGKLQEFVGKVDRGLQQLTTKLTQESRIDGALKVKQFREGDGFKSLVEGGDDVIPVVGTGGNADLGPTMTAPPETIGANSETKSDVTIERDNPTPADLPPGRIVFIPLTRGAQLPPAFQAAADADMTDIAMVGRTNYGNVGAIRSDGALVYWSGTAEPEVIPGDNISCEQSFGLPLIGLDRSGKLNATSDADAETKAAIEAQTNVMHIGVTSGICAVSRADGKLDVIGPRDDVANAEKMEQVENAAATGFSGAAFASVLKTDGTVVNFANGEELNSKAGDTIVKLHGFRIGETERGEVIQWGGGGMPMLKDIGDDPRQVFTTSKTFVAIGEDGEFFIYQKDGNSPWKRVEGDEGALEGANSFAWVGGQGEEWLLVVLPADSVTRSGLWTLEELASDRSSR